MFLTGVGTLGWTTGGHENHLSLRDLVDSVKRGSKDTMPKMHISAMTVTDFHPRPCYSWSCSCFFFFFSACCLNHNFNIVLFSCNHGLLLSRFANSCCTWKAINTWPWTSGSLHCWRRTPWEWRWTRRGTRDPGSTFSLSTSCGPWETVWVEWAVGVDLITPYYSSTFWL